MKGFLISLVDEWTIGFFYRELFNKITIGGNNRFGSVMSEIMMEYFKISPEQIKVDVTAKNKLKFTGYCKYHHFLEGINRLKKDDVIIKPAKLLERIWW